MNIIPNERASFHQPIIFLVVFIGGFMNIVRAVTLAIALLLSGCSESIPDPASVPKVTGLDTVAIVQESVARETVFDGQIEAVHQATVSAQTSGRIEALPFDTGDTVEQGELIVRISNKEQRARVESATATVAEVKARLDEARAQYKRVDEIYKQRLIAKSEFDAAAANLDAARARLESAKASLSEATQAAAYTEVHAPFAGIVLRRHVELGEFVAIGSPLMTGLSLTDLRAEVDIPQEHMAPLREHRQARVILADGRSVAAVNLRLPPSADPGTHTFKVLANLPEENYGVFPGTLVKVAFISGEQQQLLLPDAALVRRGEVTGTYVLNEQDHLSFRYVRLGSQTLGSTSSNSTSSGSTTIGSTTPEGGWPVLSGLSVGERVATDPLAAARAYRGQGEPG